MAVLMVGDLGKDTLIGVAVTTLCKAETTTTA